MHIVIDGYNFIRQSSSLRSFDRRSLEEGRNALIRFLLPYRKSKNHNITIVYDGREGDNPFEERDLLRGMEIIYSRRGREADDVIKELIDNKKGKEILVVTSDREVAHYAARRNTATLSSQEFEQTVSRIIAADQMNPPPSCEKEEKDDSSDFPARGNKKGPSRKLSRKDRHRHRSIKKL